MKKLLAGAILALAFPCLSFADIANFDTAQGWVDGDQLAATQTTQTSGITFVGSQGGYTVDSTAGTLSVPSQSFLRQAFALGGTAMDIPFGGQLIYDVSVALEGNGTFTNNRILAQIALDSSANPFTPNVGFNADNGIDLTSDGTNWFVDSPTFGVTAPIDTGFALTDGFLDVSLVYSETTAGVDLEVFVNGAATPIFSNSFGPGSDINGGSLYGWTNSTQGTAATPAGSLVFDSIGLTVVPAAIPEPSSLGFLGLGLAGFFTRRRRAS